jgi:hypothetical protein
MKGGPRNTRAPFAYVQMLLSFFVRPFLFFFSSSPFLVALIRLSDLFMVIGRKSYSASSAYKRRGERPSPITLKAMQNVQKEYIYFLPSLHGRHGL